MLIKSITLKNFKGIKDETRIDLKPITLLFGANSAGKSTILQAFLYAYELLIKGNPDPHKTYLGGKFVNLGGFKNLINNHDITKTMLIGFELDISKSNLDISLNDYLPEYLSEIEKNILMDELNSLPQKLALEHIKTIALDFHIIWNNAKQAPLVKNIVVYTNENSREKRHKGSGRARLGNLELFTVNFDKSTETVGLSTDEDYNTYLTGFSISEFHPNSSGNETAIQQVDQSTEKDGSYLANVLHYELLKSGMPPGFINNTTYEKPKIEDYDDEKMFSISLDYYENFIAAHSNVTSTATVNIGNKFSDLPDRNRIIKLGHSNWKEDIDENDFLERHGFSTSTIKTYIDTAMTCLITYPLDLLRDELEKLIYIGPIRSIPERGSDYSLFPENSGWSDGLAAWQYLIEQADDDFFDFINDWLASSDKLNSGYLIKRKRYKELDVDIPLDKAYEELGKTKEKRRLYLEHKSTGLEVHPYDVGVGISQILPVLVASLKLEKSKKIQSGIVVVEQPELHIHPRLQVALGDMFAMVASNPYLDKLFLLETHSEHLMLRLLRRIRETTENSLTLKGITLTPSDVAVLYVENKPDGTTITNLEINEDGDFDNDWPDGFFDERDEELF